MGEIIMTIKSSSGVEAGKIITRDSAGAGERKKGRTILTAYFTITVKPGYEASLVERFKNLISDNSL
jgi:hypothetical protein